MNGPLRHLIRVGCAFARSNSDQVGTVLWVLLCRLQRPMAKRDKAIDLRSS